MRNMTNNGETEHKKEAEKLNYHTQYKFKKAVVKAVRKCVQEGGLWRLKNAGDFDGALVVLKQLAKDLCEIYEIRMPRRIIYDEYEYYCFRGSERGTLAITEGVPSIVSFLHEFRHHWQYMKRKHEGNEADCRAYSLGLYRVAFPNTFRRIWSENRIHFMPAYQPTVIERESEIEQERQEESDEQNRR